MKTMKALHKEPAFDLNARRQTSWQHFALIMKRSRLDSVSTAPEISVKKLFTVTVISGYVAEV
jgi:hypothetical protein